MWFIIAVKLENIKCKNVSNVLYNYITYLFCGSLFILSYCILILCCKLIMYLFYSKLQENILEWLTK